LVGSRERCLLPHRERGSPSLKREVQLVLGAFVLVLNVAIYAWVVARARRERVQT
jgi:hypothetical protein